MTASTQPSPAADRRVEPQPPQPDIAGQFSTAGLISWDRALGAPGVRGLWSSGFIANRRELIEQLGARAESSDLELAAGLCARLGTEAPRRIHGPFAWIVWDGDRQRLVAVRDRLGVNELYYTQRNAEILLAGSLELLL